MIKLIKSSEYTHMPWKNGQGVTSQIDIFPEGVVFPDGHFLWRISSATVVTTSVFSKFPGYSRCLAVLSGEGMHLNELKLFQGEVLRFEGEESISGGPIEGPVVKKKK